MYKHTEKTREIRKIILGRSNLNKKYCNEWSNPTSFI